MIGLRFSARAICLLMMLAFSGLASVPEAAEIRGTVSSVEANGQVRINIPSHAAVFPGDPVRIDSAVTGAGPVQTKSRWRIKEIGPGYAIASPEGKPSGTPRAGNTAIVMSEESAPIPAASTPAPAAPPSTALTQEETATGTEAPLVPSLKLTAEQVAGVQKQADGGDVRAMRMLGFYHSGKADPSDTVARSLNESIRWYKKAAQSGDARAMTSLGFLYRSKRKDDTKAAEWFHKGAEKGDGSAMSTLSRLYAQGRGVPKDSVQSFEWAKKAAQNGDDFAVYELAQMYFNGNGTRQDFVEATLWYLKAAEKGFAPAMTQLARMYTAGMGLAQDLSRGFEWAKTAAEAGSPIAMYQVGTLYLQGTGVSSNPSEAKKWYEKAANAGEAEGMFALSYLYDKGLGVTANPGLAADWMILAIRSHSYQAAESVMRTPWKWSKTFRKEFQKRLNEAGVYQGTIDGNIGSGSRRAIAAMSKETS